MTTREELGQRIRRARRSKRLTQQELGKLASIRQPSVSDLERSQTKVGVLDLLQIAQILDRPITFFIPEAASGKLTADEEEVVYLYRHIKAAGNRDMALGALRAIAGAAASPRE